MKIDRIEGKIQRENRRQYKRKGLTRISSLKIKKMKVQGKA
jgi:hypothetical protein